MARGWVDALGIHIKPPTLVMNDGGAHQSQSVGTAQISAPVMIT